MSIKYSSIAYFFFVQEFFLRVKDLLRKLPTGVDSYVKFGEREKELLWKLHDSKTAVHEALCGRFTITHTHTYSNMYAHTLTFTHMYDSI